MLFILFKTTSESIKQNLKIRYYWVNLSWNGRTFLMGDIISLSSWKATSPVGEGRGRVVGAGPRRLPHVSGGGALRGGPHVDQHRKRACGRVNGRVRVDSGPQWRHLRDEGRRWCRRRQARRRRRCAQRRHPAAEASRQEVTIHQLTAPLLPAASAPSHGLLCYVCDRPAVRCGTHLWKWGMVFTVHLRNKEMVL